MDGHGAKYPRKHEEAVLALLAHSTVPEAARAVGIGERTLWKWMQREDFREAYRKARAEVVRHAVAQVQRGMGKAVETLVEVMEDKGAPQGSRVSAAKAMLDLGLRAVEFEELEARLTKLEAQVAGKAAA